MMLKSLAAALVLTVSLAPAVGTAQGAAPLTTSELNGRWVLTIVGNPPGTKGPQITVTDDAGKPLSRMIIDLEVRSLDQRAARCTITRREMPSSRKATACRLDRGAFVVDIAGSGNGQKGVMSMRLARGASGVISGPAVVRAPVLPIRLKIGAATLTRA